jgi:scavenger receptor class B protein 1
MAIELPPIVRAALSGSLAAIGFMVLVGALICLTRAANRQEKLHLSTPLSVNVKGDKNLSPTFQNHTVKKSQTSSNRH